MSALASIRTRLSTSFFEPASAMDLGAARIVFFAGSLASFARSWGRPLPLPLEMAAWRDFSPALWHPVAIHRWLPAEGISAAALRGIGFAFLAALAFSALGLFTRAATLVSFVLGLFCLGYVNDFGFVDQQNNATVFVLGAMAFSPAGDALSIDAWFRERKGGGAVLERSGEYRWPIRLGALCLVLIYFASAVAKLRANGLAWTRGEDLAWLITSHSIGNPSAVRFGVVPNTLALAVAKHVTLCSVLAKATLLLELSAPLALLGRRNFAGIVLALFVLTVSMAVFMGVSFAMTLLPLYAMEVPWASIARRFVGRWALP